MTHVVSEVTQVDSEMILPPSSEPSRRCWSSTVTPLAESLPAGGNHLQCRQSLQIIAAGYPEYSGHASELSNVNSCIRSASETCCNNNCTTYSKDVEWKVATVWHSRFRHNRRMTMPPLAVVIKHQMTVTRGPASMPVSVRWQSLPHSRPTGNVQTELHSS